MHAVRISEISSYEPASVRTEPLTLTSRNYSHRPVKLISRCTRVQDGAQPRAHITHAPWNGSFYHLQAVQSTNQPHTCRLCRIERASTRAYATLT